MACRSCKRQLALLARQAHAGNAIESSSSPISSASSVSGAAIAQPLPRRVAPTPLAHHQQRRTFRSTPTQAGFGDSLRNLVARTAQPYRVIGATKGIYDICSKAALYEMDPVAVAAGTVPMTPEGEHIGKGNGMWHNNFKLPPTFSTWAQITMLHMYLVFARLRNLDKDTARQWQSQLVDHFFFDAEERMNLNHGISSRGLRSKYLKDLFVQWRGLIAAYDEGVVKNDAVLASAVWRNVYKARDDVDLQDLAAVVSWMRRCLKTLDQIPDTLLYYQAGPALKWPAKNEFALVDKPSPLLADQLLAAANTPVGAETTPVETATTPTGTATS
ncbi:ubiquinol-cytochrome C chaperone-domain-containing protein [Astrocystis sublimbata]|nr:ubiquinol-cytochrome C chaperone-domain-containing protein [Astrocystis sublimbata]